METSQCIITYRKQAKNAKQQQTVAMATQTKDQQRRRNVLLMSMEDYNGDNIISDKLTFSITTINLIERPKLYYLFYLPLFM